MSLVCHGSISLTMTLSFVERVMLSPSALSGPQGQAPRRGSISLQIPRSLLRGSSLLVILSLLYYAILDSILPCDVFSKARIPWAEPFRARSMGLCLSGFVVSSFRSDFGSGP